MKWKSFKQEKPLLGQRILIYEPQYLDWHVHSYGGERDLSKVLYRSHDKNSCLWIPIPCLPEDMKEATTKELA